MRVGHKLHRSFQTNDNMTTAWLTETIWKQPPLNSGHNTQLVIYIYILYQYIILFHMSSNSHMWHIQYERILTWSGMHHKQYFQYSGYNNKSYLKRINIIKEITKNLHPRDFRCHKPSVSGLREYPNKIWLQMWNERSSVGSDPEIPVDSVRDRLDIWVYKNTYNMWYAEPLIPGVYRI